ncbi:MAG TPA: T9SS type A sorting domain-containing protein [Puia sp.]|nr:T9SS type A sorting domain-containing protein [Puia sp.]
MRKLYTGVWLSGRRHWLLAFFVLYSISSSANVYNVTVTTDGNANNQLRGAILAASAAGAGPHTIHVAAGTYNLTMGEIIFGNSAVNLSIIGAGSAATTINMTTTGQDRIFLINTTGTVSDIQVTMTGLTFTGGHLTSDNFGGGAIICGGPNNSTTLTDCLFNSNTIDGNAGGNGGAIAMTGGGALTIDRCKFSSNSVQTGSGGALYYASFNTYSGSLAITNSSFSDNQANGAGGAGGALSVIIPGALAGTTSSVIIQKNSFLFNQATSDGGAVMIINSFSTSNTVSFNYNRLTGNSSGNGVTGAIGMGSSRGNVDATNNWWGCNAGPASPTGCDKAAITGTGGAGTLDLSSWLQLTSAASSSSICSGNAGNTNIIKAGFGKNSAGSSIPASNLTAFAGLRVSFSATSGNLSGSQSTFQSDGTATTSFTSDGTAGTATVSPATDNVPNNDALASTSFTVNTAPTITVQPTPWLTCTGNAAIFNVTASGGSLSYLWNNGGHALSDGMTGSGSSLSGTATPSLTIHQAGTADDASGYYVAVGSGNGCQTNSNQVMLVVSPIVIPNASSSGTGTVSADNSFIDDGSCNRIARVLPAGATPVSGMVTSKLTVDSGQPSLSSGQPYVLRHFDIEPATNAAVTTATLTLYVPQSDFDSYNAAMPGTANDLPTAPSDAAGKANLRITQFHGTGTAPGNYTGWTGSGPAAVLINPGASNVQWNSTTNYWEISFDVTGFSGFYITGMISSPLPVKLESFTADDQPSGVRLQWIVGEEENVSRYEIERSPDGHSFKPVVGVPASHMRRYEYWDTDPIGGTSYYRLKMIDNDAGSSYSQVVVLNRSIAGWSLQAAPNPFHNQLQVRIIAPDRETVNVELLDLAGKRLLQEETIVQKGANTLLLSGLDKYSSGTYFLRLEGRGIHRTIKLVKTR